MDIFYGKRGSGKTHKLIQRIVEHAKYFGTAVVICRNPKELRSYIFSNYCLNEPQRVMKSMYFFKDIKKVKEEVEGLNNIKVFVDGVEELIFRELGYPLWEITIDTENSFIQRCSFNEPTEYTPYSHTTAYIPCTKPPLGIKPQRIMDEERMKEISEAIIRFVDAGKPIPAEWFEELNEIKDRRNK
jgi:hypothetical protein